MLKDAAGVYSFCIYTLIDTRCSNITALGPLPFKCTLQMIKLRDREERGQKKTQKELEAQVEIPSMQSTR